MRREQAADLRIEHAIGEERSGPMRPRPRRGATVPGAAVAPATRRRRDAALHAAPRRWGSGAGSRGNRALRRRASRISTPSRTVGAITTSESVVEARERPAAATRPAASAVTASAVWGGRAQTRPERAMTTPGSGRPRASASPSRQRTVAAGSRDSERVDGRERTERLGPAHAREATQTPAAACSPAAPR